jgi:ABC-type bacteriocin/lantibiotic exporter with double-glycine peptidase domain
MRRAHALLVPEVVQSSAMDCGPAALGSLLGGFGIPVSYGRLREACQTDVDGTSIDTLEDIAVALGLDAEQVVTPRDHLLRPEAEVLPAIGVVRLPNGVTHFVVVWSTFGPWVQIMDPGSGRVWVRRDKLLNQLYIHAMPVPADSWREWAATENFLGPLRARLRALGLEPETLLGPALADEGASTLACLDAATRMVHDLVEAGALLRGREAGRAIESLANEAKLRELADWSMPAQAWSIPQHYWSAAPMSAGEDGELQVRLRGAVFVRCRGRRAETDTPEVASTFELPPDLVTARNEQRTSPARTLAQMVVRDGWLTPMLVLGSLLIASAGLLIETALLRGLVELGVELDLVSERLVAWSALVAFAVSMLLLEGAVAGELLGIGRRLETRLRVAFLTKVPRLGARYFQSRLSSDMAERIHAMHGLRRLPELGAELVRSVCSLILTVIGIAWLDGGGALAAALAAVALLLATFTALPTLAERDLRFRTHGGALSRVYLDALQGLVPVRTHGAARAVRREHEQLLVEWMRAGLDLVRAAVTVETIQAIVGFAVVIAITLRHSLAAGEVGAMLLLVYWSLQLPDLGARIGELVRQYPSHRSRALRLLEPIGAPDEDRSPSHARAPDEDHPTEPTDPTDPPGVSLQLDAVTVRAAGHMVLDDITLTIEPGEHIAIVGPSGAGKSSLVGLLLGWHRPAQGELRVDGEPLDGHRLAELRRETAWVDPAVALWNQALVDNLLYGSPSEALDRVGPALRDADLLELVANLPEGLQTSLGEAGALLSGGEGQRVRLARALLRPGVRLVILDEPLRGLDRERRGALIRRIRAWWPSATLLCVSHDLEETREFARVVVLADGHVVEDGPPERLLADADGAYSTMLAQERQVHAQLWQRPDWRRLTIADGSVVEHRIGERRIGEYRVEEPIP